MTGVQSLIARTSLSVLIGGISIIVCSIRRLFSLPRQSFDRLVNIAFVLSRFAIYIVVFLLLHLEPRGDVVGFYWREAKFVLGHLLPYRDFSSPYAPLHPYLDAIALHIWYSPLALILLVLLVETLVLPLWLRVGRLFLTEEHLRTSALLYLTSAISIQFVTINGQNNVMIAVLLVLALLLVSRHQAFASGAAVGLGVVAVKFLPLLYVPGFIAAVPRRWRWLAGLSMVIAIVYGICLFLHLPSLQPLISESGLKSADDLPYVFESITGFTVPSIVWDMLVLVLCGSIYLLIAVKSRGATLPLRLRILTFGFAALTVALILFSKKSWPPYLMLSLFPICLLFRSKLNIAGFALLGVVSAASHSYWETLLVELKATGLHQGLLSRDPKCILFLFIELVLIVCYAWVLQAALRQIYRSPLAVEVTPANEESLFLISSSSRPLQPAENVASQAPPLGARASG
jgi:hypothetical protein